MMKRLFVLFFLLLLASPTLALEIFYPADGTYVIHSDFLIIKAGPNVDGVTLEIGGEKSDLLDMSSAEYREAFQDFLIVQPNWDPGKNLVKVEAYKGEKKVAEKQADFYFQANPNEPPPKNYQRFVMHKPEQEVFCAGCHNMNPTQDQLRMMGADNPCASCHKRMLEHSNIHGPAGAWQCAYCHEAESQPSRYAPRKFTGDLCYECHEDMADELKNFKFVHGPVEVGQCNLCHDSHASDFPSQIITKTNQLCLGCHEGIDTSGHVGRGVGGASHPLSGIADPSRPYRDLSCTGCHDPHGGAVEYLFQQGISSRMQLCQVCHKK